MYKTAQLIYFNETSEKIKLQFNIYDNYTIRKQKGETKPGTLAQWNYSEWNGINQVKNWQKTVILWAKVCGGRTVDSVGNRACFDRVVMLVFSDSKEIYVLNTRFDSLTCCKFRRFHSNKITYLWVWKFHEDRIDLNFLILSLYIVFDY